jgi:hypothetical protein
MASGGSKPKLLVSLDNFETLNEPLDSPRSLRALTECGYVPQDVYVKPLHAFIDKKVADPELRQTLAQVKFDHLEEKRKEKLRLVRAERARIIERQSLRRAQNAVGASNNNADDAVAEASDAARIRPSSAPDGAAVSPKSPGVEAVRG